SPLIPRQVAKVSVCIVVHHQPIRWVVGSLQVPFQLLVQASVRLEARRFLKVYVCDGRILFASFFFEGPGSFPEARRFEVTDEFPIFVVDRIIGVTRTSRISSCILQLWSVALIVSLRKPTEFEALLDLLQFLRAFDVECSSVRNVRLA